MTDYNDINLPADFDDLSKHAPLLDKLRAKGDGFVVPEGFFAESINSAVIVSQLSAVGGSDAGLIVPENYFEELTERILAVVALANADNRKLIPIAIGNNSFIVPEDYFNELDETLNTKIALDNLKQDEGFGVPENYFEKFSDKILSRLAVDELNEGSGADVPSGYFDTLADRISARIAEEENIPIEKAEERGRIIVFTEVIKRYTRPVSIAASVALLIGVSIWFFNRGTEVKNEKGVIATNHPVKKQEPQIIVVPKKDSITIPQPENTAVVEKPLKHKNPHRVNPQPEPVVKEVEKQDLITELDMIDVNVIADYVQSENNSNRAETDPVMNDEMLKYLNDHTDINIDLNN